MIIAEGIVIVESFFDEAECQEWIQRSEQQGYEQATVSFQENPTMMKSLRNNDRVTFEDAGLASVLWPRVQPYAAEAYRDETPDSLNERFRFYRYTPGQRFKRHIDGSVELGELKSRITFMVYLNENFTGGETIFREKGSPPGSDEEHIIRPQRGLALLFDHRLWHEGAEVTEGSKYVLRSDVFFSTMMSDFC